MHKFFKSLWFILLLFIVIFSALYIYIASTGEVYCELCPPDAIKSCYCPTYVESMNSGDYFRLGFFSAVAALIIYGAVRGADILIARKKN
jgi:hypothetical protein